MKIILLIVAIIVVLVVFVSAFLLWHDIQILQKIESMQNTEGIRAIEHIDWDSNIVINWPQLLFA